MLLLDHIRVDVCSCLPSSPAIDTALCIRDVSRTVMLVMLIYPGLDLCREAIRSSFSFMLSILLLLSEPSSLSSFAFLFSLFFRSFSNYHTI